jgi:hypothetical protein
MQGGVRMTITPRASVPVVVRVAARAVRVLAPEALLGQRGLPGCEVYLRVCSLHGLVDMMPINANAVVLAVDMVC